MNFEFSTAGRIIFGPGTSQQLADLARPFGRRALVVTGRNPARVEPLLSSLRKAGIAVFIWSVAKEPTVENVDGGSVSARSEGCEMVIGMGGGSALDSAKGIAALARNGGEVLDYLEVVGRGKLLDKPSLPFLAVPTTAGTGAEVTRNAVLLSTQHRVKASLRSTHMLAQRAVVDPALTLDLPPALTASTGLDALTQLLEAYVSCRATALTDLVCREGLVRVSRSLRRAFHQGQDRNARVDMALASLYSGMALANAGLGAVHGFAAPIGGMFDAPHGAVCAALLPAVIDVNVRALRERLPHSPALDRFEQAAALLTGKAQATIPDAIAWVSGLCRELAVQPLQNYGVTPETLPEIAAKAAQSSSMRANPLPLKEEELMEILNRSLAF